MLRWLATILLGGALWLPGTGHAQPAGAAYTDLFYPSGGLQIHAFLYKRQSMPFVYIGGLLTQAGYVVLVPALRVEGRFHARRPGHQVFSARVMHVWEADVLEFLGRHLSAESRGEGR